MRIDRMKREIELPEELCFIADRHHVTSQQLLRYFLYGETSISLEPNEVEILKGLSGMIRSDRTKEIKTR